MRNFKPGLLSFLLGAALAIAFMGTRAAWPATTILPPGATCFQQAAGPVSSGSVYMLVPSTTTPKNTWQNSAQSVLNTNPIQLDANGCAIIYGTGSYRQQVYTGPVVSGLPSGFLLYDVTTADTSSFQSVFWAGLAGGTANALTVVDAGFNNTDGSVINFIALTSNTGSATLNVSGGGAIPIKTQSSSGPVSIASGCFGPNNPVSVVYSSTQAAFLLLTACSLSPGTVTAVSFPQGYLSLSNDTQNPIITTDVTGATTVYYTSYVGNQLPVWNGTAYVLFTFSQLPLTLAAGNIANTIYDVCAFSNNGVITLATGPAWSNSAAGAGARGTGAGTPQLQRVNGLWVNAVQIAGLNGANTYTIPANQCTYLGSILTDSTPGQVSNNVTFGTIRKWGVWNAYNRVPILVQQGLTTGAQIYYQYATGTWRASDGFSTNTMSLLSGLAEENVKCNSQQFINPGTMVTTTIAVNWASGTPTNVTMGTLSGLSGVATVPVIDEISPFLGLDTVITTEISSGTSSFAANQSGMTLQCAYRG